MAREAGEEAYTALQRLQSGFCLRLLAPSPPAAPRPAPPRPPPWAGEQRPMGERRAGAR